MEITQFGITAQGESVHKITLDNTLLRCELLTYGATIQRLFVPDDNGNQIDVVLGYDTLQEYERNAYYFGATIGRVANRIAGGKFSLNEKEYALAVNNGPNHLHGGFAGFSHKVWQIARTDATSVTLTLESPDGDEGYPGNLTVSVEYVLEENMLSIRYKATTDQDTLCNLTNHSYFNLAGHNCGDALAQEIQLFAGKYTPSNDVGIPYGTMEAVDGTPMDLQKPTPIGGQIHAAFPQLQQARGYDHNYVIDGQPGTLRPGAVAHSHKTGITMQMQTTMPGVHFYTANFVSEGHPGKGGCIYGSRHGFCLETQFFPDSPNQPAFPSIVLLAGKTYCHTTAFSFCTKKK